MRFSHISVANMMVAMLEYVAPYVLANMEVNTCLHSLN